LICPWNGFAKLSAEADFLARHHLNDISLLAMWQWSEADFLAKTEGSPIRRTGYAGMMRNVAVALGNAPYQAEIVLALAVRREELEELVQVHVDWAIEEQLGKQR